MRIFAFIAITLVALSGATGDVVSQSPATPSQEATGTISGRVTIENEAAPDIAVVLQPASSSFPLPPPVARATTDKEGRFKMTGVAAGRYYAISLAAAYFAPSEDRIAPGKPVTLLKGENLEGIELDLKPGGVITGRVTTAGGYPVIGQESNPILTDLRVQQQLPNTIHGGSRFKTDDRGIFRVYGLPAGRYIVSVRSERRGPWEETFYPGVTDRTRANPVEVMAGKVIENIDIKLAPITRSLAFEVSGRVVDEATGQPIPKIRVDLRTLEIRGKGVSYHRGGPEANEKGEFRFTDLSPGRYAVVVSLFSPKEHYSDEVTFDVVDQDVSGVEIKARRGGSISGKVIIEGSRDPAILSDLSHLQITVFRMAGGLGIGAEASADGRFRITGLAPEKYRVRVYSKTERQRFSLVGVDRNGALQPDGIEVTTGEHVTGLRLVVAYGTGVVRGQAQVINGSLPEGARMWVSARRADIQTPKDFAEAFSVDARGRFLLEGLATGAYEISLTVDVPAPPGAARPLRRLASVKQTCSVTSGAESQVTLVLDVNAATVKEEKK